MSRPSRLLRVVAWTIGVPAAIGSLLVGVMLLSARSPGTTPTAGAVLLLAGSAGTLAVIVAFRRLRRAAAAIEAIPHGERFERIRLRVVSTAYSGAARSEGSAGTWLDVGTRNLLIHDGMRHRALVPKSSVRARIVRTRWGQRLELAFEPRATVLESGRPVTMDRLVLQMPEEPVVGALEILGASAEEIATARPGRESTVSDIFLGIPLFLLAVAFSPWPGYVVGRGIARRLSETPRTSGWILYLVVAGISWLLTAALIWFGARREWYDFDDAAPWLMIASPFLALVVAVPVGFALTV